MAAVFLRTIRNELPTAGSAFRTLGSIARFPVIVPPTQAAGIRAELFLFPAGGMCQCSAALSASVARLYSRFFDRLYAITLAI